MFERGVCILGVIAFLIVNTSIGAVEINVEDSPRGAEVGLLIAGSRRNGYTNELKLVSRDPVFNIGNIRRSNRTDEVIAFTNGRPVKQEAVDWSATRPSLRLRFKPLIVIDSTMWIVKGPFAKQKQTAIDACIQTNMIWYNERMGVLLGCTDIRDATGSPKARAHFAFPDGGQGDVVWKPLRDDIGFTNDRLNIYWVDTVNGANDWGWSNFGAQIVMGSATGFELLSHEIGHAFGLVHVDKNGGASDAIAAQFNDENIMSSVSSRRKYITEGQLLRAHLNPSSVLNNLYQSRQGEATRDCDDGASHCVPLWKRLWADGVLRAN